MKILLSTLNAKFIHSSLALAYLYEFCRDDSWSIEIREFTINERNEDIMAGIFMCHPDILCFSCYIWNIEAILEVCEDYKKIAPDTLIILGGPEVSYDAGEILKENKAIDCIIRGEGECSLREALESIIYNKPWDKIRGVSYRESGQIYENRDRDLIGNLDIIPSPYRGDLSRLKNHIVYYESSRGCPFNCAYCLSSTIKGVRFFSLPRVKEDLQFLIKQGVKEVKFVDRTFNCNEKRAREIMQFIIEQGGTSRFHFEICADLLSPEMIKFLAQVPSDLFDFEVGVQSTCSEALQAVKRTSDWPQLRNNLKELLVQGNIHIHLDLIAGLPCESYERFAQSFNDVYELHPDVIQLGFLKLLKGSSIRSGSEDYGYKFKSRPPYQVLAHNCLSYEEIMKLEHIEDLLERYYNSHRVEKTLVFIIDKIFSGNAFSFYEDFAWYWQEKNLFGLGHKREAEYSFIMDYISSYHSDYLLEVNEILKYDYFLNNKSYNLPRGIESCNPGNVNEILYACLKNEDFMKEMLPFLKSKTPREIRRQVHLEYFKFNPLNVSILKTAMPLLFVYNPVKRKAEKIISLDKYIRE